VYAGKMAYLYKGTMPANTSITLLDGTKSIGGSAFYNCTGLTSVTIPNSVTSIWGSAFSGCTGLTSVTFAAGSNITDANFSGDAFPNGAMLKAAYSNGGAGTYTRPSGGSVWTKQ
jgi:hypothetical protein